MFEGMNDGDVDDVKMVEDKDKFDDQSASTSASQNNNAVAQGQSGEVKRTTSAGGARRFTYVRTSTEEQAGADDAGCSATPESSNKCKMTPTDFIFKDTLGDGSFSTVYLAVEVKTRQEYAIKVCAKDQIRKERKARYILREKEVMAKLNEHGHPFFVRLYSTFQDSTRLYFVMTLALNGEMLDVMRRLGSFDDNVTRFYAAEIVAALEHLHSLNIIHRDLKPENILLSDKMHIMISDFGSAKIIGKEDEDDTRTGVRLEAARALARARQQQMQENDDEPETRQKRRSFVGTAQYVSPEVLNQKSVTVSCDYWALGCIIYQMLSGLPPFRAPTEYLIFQKIIKVEYEFPGGFPPVARDLVEKLLIDDRDGRLGAPAMGGIDSIKEHPFFVNTDWDTLPDQSPPDMHPYLPAQGDEPAFTSKYRHALSRPMPGNAQPGLDEQQMSRLLTQQIYDVRNRYTDADHTPASPRTRRKPEHLLDFSEADKEDRLRIQRRDNPYNRFVENNLILKSGYIDKKKGLFARRRMFLLTTGPHLYYVEPTLMELKGQIPLSKTTRTEAKNFRTFFVHTPNRTYYLFDSENRAIDWCNAIDQIRDYYFGPYDEADEDEGKTPATVNNVSHSMPSNFTAVLRKISSAKTPLVSSRDPNPPE